VLRRIRGDELLEAPIAALAKFCLDGTRPRFARLA
jgi:hypothetical protein